MEQTIDLLRFNIDVKTYTKSGDILLAAPVNGWTATNLGDTIAEINGIQLLPGVPGTSRGDSVTIGGNYGEKYIGPIRLAFASPGGAVPLVEIIQKFYV
jgi:hypothetical protein